MLSIKSKYFYGNKVSDYGLENGYVDYETLAKSFQCVLNNDIIAINLSKLDFKCLKKETLQ